MIPSNSEPQGMLLSLIAQGLGASVWGQGDPFITGLHHDSRRVEPGDLFVARRGEHSDGLDFVARAVDQGAVAIMAESGHFPAVSKVPILLVPDVRAAIGQAANMVYGDPTSRFDVIGITGTNGKTTSSYMVRAAIDGAGGKTGVLGTLGATFGTLHFGAVHTTPEADEVARIAHAMQRNGASHMVMEVSSHALDQRRADLVHFRVAAFTNLTQDHLDYHGTLQAYAAAKERLFFDLFPKTAVILVDDHHGADLAHRVSSHVERCLRVSTNQDADADIKPAGPVHFHARGLTCDVLTPSVQVHLKAPFVGKHNLANLLLALGIVEALDLPVDKASKALEAAEPVPGRLERCDTLDDDIVVLVDYAHTPDALQRALQTMRSLTQRKVFCVFGGGGDRDRSKRPIMGSVVGSLADVAIVTNDNPRSEEPRSIADAIVDGMRDATAQVMVELDRARAIDKAIQEASAGDVVLVAGKGHEPYQIIGDEKHYFDDRQEVRAALRRRRRTQGKG